jgi:lipoprotein-releasing system permease protein
MSLMSKTANRAVSWLAGRYLRGRNARIVSKNHYLTLAGITLGVLALLCVSSVMNGFREDIGLRISGTLSQIRMRSMDSGGISNPDSLISVLKDSGIAASAVIRNELLAKKGTVVLPAFCFGIDADDHKSVSRALNPLSDNGMGLRQGLIAGTASQQALDADGIILAAGLAGGLGLYLGDEIQLISPRFNIPTAFGMIPRVKTFKVMGVFESAMPEYQQSYAYVSLENAKFFSGKSTVDQLDLRAGDFSQSEALSKTLQKKFPQYKVEPWSRFDASLYSAIRFEKMLMFTIMLLMYVIASFNLTGNMLKSIAQKKKELGLLKAIGFRDKDLSSLFLRQSLFLSSFGILLGLVLASLLLWLQSNYGFVKLAAGDDFTVLPVKVLWQDYVVVVIASYTITFLSVLLPLRRLREVDPIALIRQHT